MFSSTLVVPKRLLMPTTLVAFWDEAATVGFGLCSSISFSSLSRLPSINVQPIACEEQHAKNQKGKRVPKRWRLRWLPLSALH
jgi:hypothetical protein